MYHFGSMLALFWNHVGPFGAILGPFRARLGPLGSHLGPFLDHRGDFGTIRKHLGALDEVLARDPIISRDVRMAKKNILNPPKKPAKKGPEKDLEEANKKLEDIRKIIK